MERPETSNKKLADQAAFIGIFGNLLLTSFKLFAGVTGHSAAMISDGVHSLSDVLASAIAAVGVRVGRKEADRGHPYGHEKVESLAAFLLGLILAGAGLMIAVSGVRQLIGSGENEQIPGILPLVAACVSIVVKEWMYRWTKRAAKKLRSPALAADAKHHRSDALSSIGSLIGIAGARLKWSILDPLASVLIAGMILKSAWDILKHSADELLDTACADEMEEAIRETILCQEDVVGLDLLVTRRFGNRIYVDAEIEVYGDMDLWSSHAVAERVHDAVEARFDQVKHIMVHVNPVKRQEEKAGKDSEK